MKKNKGQITLIRYPYHSSTAIVMEVDKCSCILHCPFFGIYEGFGELYSVVNIVAAAAPIELSSVVPCFATLVRVTVARL